MNSTTWRGPTVVVQQWLSPPVYPHATKQFYEMFENDDSQYDGVYAMLVSVTAFGMGRSLADSQPLVTSIGLT